LRIIIRRQEDPQRQAPLHICSLCGGELYRGDLCRLFGGQVICEDCLEAFARAEFAAFEHICGEEERT